MTKHPSLCMAALLVAVAAAPVYAAGNLIDLTYGAGAGSFELGAFTPIQNSGPFFFQSLANAATTMTGWKVGGVGVDWLGAPSYAAADGQHAVDLGYYQGGAGSVSVLLATQVGATYALDFKAAAITGHPLYTHTGVVTAGSLNSGFTVPTSGDDNFTGQVYHDQNFTFVANSASTWVTIAAAVPDSAYGPVIDQVSVSFVSAPVPEPAAMGLAVVAGLGLAAVARRRTAG